MQDPDSTSLNIKEDCFNIFNPNSIVSDVNGDSDPQCDNSMDVYQKSIRLNDSIDHVPSQESTRPPRLVPISTFQKNAVVSFDSVHECISQTQGALQKSTSLDLGFETENNQMYSDDIFSGCLEQSAADRCVVNNDNSYGKVGVCDNMNNNNLNTNLNNRDYHYNIELNEEMNRNFNNPNQFNYNIFNNDFSTNNNEYHHNNMNYNNIYRTNQMMDGQNLGLSMTSDNNMNNNNNNFDGNEYGRSFNHGMMQNNDTNANSFNTFNSSLFGSANLMEQDIYNVNQQRSSQHHHHYGNLVRQPGMDEYMEIPQMMETSSFLMNDTNVPSQPPGLTNFVDGSSNDTSKSKRSPRRRKRHDSQDPQSHLKRHNHNMLERKRRFELRTSFTRLIALVPELQGVSISRLSKVKVLSATTNYVTYFCAMKNLRKELTYTRNTLVLSILKRIRDMKKANIVPVVEHGGDGNASENANIERFDNIYNTYFN